MDGTSSFTDESVNVQNNTHPDNALTLRTKSTLPEDLRRIQCETKGYTDCVLIFSNGARIKLHSIALCAASNKWQKLFEQKHGPSHFEDGHLKISVPDGLSLEIVVKVLHIAYLGEVLLAKDDIPNLESPLQYFGIEKKEMIEFTQLFRPEKFIEEQILKFKNWHIRFTKDKVEALMGADTSIVPTNDLVSPGLDDRIKLFCVNCGAVCKSNSDIYNHPKRTSCPANAQLKLYEESRRVTFTCGACNNLFVDLMVNQKRNVSTNGAIPLRLSLPTITDSPKVTKPTRFSMHLPTGNNASDSDVPKSVCMHCRSKESQNTSELDPMKYSRMFCRRCQQVFNSQAEENEHGQEQCLYKDGYASVGRKIVDKCSIEGCGLEFLQTYEPDKGLLLHQKFAHCQANSEQEPPAKSNGTAHDLESIIAAAPGTVAAANRITGNKVHWGTNTTASQGQQGNKKPNHGVKMSAPVKPRKSVTSVVGTKPARSTTGTSRAEPIHAASAVNNKPKVSKPKSTTTANPKVSSTTHKKETVPAPTAVTNNKPRAVKPTSATNNKKIEK